MNKTIRLFLLLALFSLTITGANAQSKDEQQIRSSLAVQQQAWNDGDLDLFMQPYWKNDSLMFIGKTGVTYGWQNTLDNYKKSYPGAAAMGKLNFTLLQVKRLSADYFSVTGKWELARSIGDISGHFTLLFRKINNTWVIISDHSS
jgi:ketosteroid isomerase-like protein